MSEKTGADGLTTQLQSQHSPTVFADRGLRGYVRLVCDSVKIAARDPPRPERGLRGSSRGRGWFRRGAVAGVAAGVGWSADAAVTSMKGCEGSDAASFDSDGASCYACEMSTDKNTHMDEMVELRPPPPRSSHRRCHRRRLAPQPTCPPTHPPTNPPPTHPPTHPLPGQRRRGLRQRRLLHDPPLGLRGRL